MSSDRVGPAPPWQVPGVFGLRQRHRSLQRRREVLVHRLGLDPSAQEIGPQKFTERGDVLGETSRVAKVSGQAAVGIIMELVDRGRDSVETRAAAVGIIGVTPALVVEVGPERRL